MAELCQGTAGSTGTAGCPGRAKPAGSPEVLVIVCTGVVLASLDLFIVTVALPAIARDLGSRNLGELSWVLNGYAIVYASLLVLAGKLAGRHRRKYGFLLGVATVPPRVTGHSANDCPASPAQTIARPALHIRLHVHGRYLERG